MFKEGSLSLSTEGVIIRFSRSLKDVLGYGPEDVIGKDIESIAGKGASKALFSGGGSAVMTGQPLRMICKDGSAADVYVSVYQLRDHAGHLYSHLLTLSSEKPVQVPAILSDEFQRIFRFSNDAVAVTDRDGQIIDVNRAFLDTYGYTREEVLGNNPRVLKSAHSTRELYERMWQEILDPAKCCWRGEIINRTKDGREVPVLLSINAIKDGDGEIRNFLGIAFDMTREKEMERLNRMFIDYIVHDMRNPVTSILVNSELVLMQLGEGLPEKTRKKIETIRACSEKIASMTNDMLDYSKAGSGSIVLKKEMVPLDKVIRLAALPFGISSKRLLVNGLPFDESFYTGKSVEADPDKLQRIIYNLLSNAFKNAVESIHLSLEVFPDKLRVTVSDDGKGLSPLDAGRIFDVFYQTEEGVKTGGAGLGLSIVKSFVEAHGGSVWVEPGAGSGAAFGFSIPL